MDIKEYIASGILESYALGFASDQERREVECLSSIYPELKEELITVQQSLEAYAQTIAVTPPVGLKETILSAIKEVPQEKTHSLKVVPAESKEAVQETAKIVRMDRYLKVGIAASFVLLVGIGVLYQSTSRTNRELRTELAAVQTKVDTEYKNQIASLKDSLSLNASREELLLADATREIILAGTEVSPLSKARVFWNEEQERFMLISDDLPSPVSGKQYQLWAIADGKPVDLGVLDKTSKMTTPKAISLAKIQAFAITLEKDGGSPVPTMDQMYVVGSI